ncbi:hypothetical protein D7V91_11525 [bacterium 1xD42-67]|nr:hypothetical protein D7V91_11525 [bacterium 1xD42-67]
MIERKTLAQEMEDILNRLKELSKLDFPKYRTYKRPDGTWVDREPVPEYLEQEELIRRWQELQAVEQYFHREHNQLLIGLQLWCLANDLADEPKPMDIPLLVRIATTVSAS